MSTARGGNTRQTGRGIGLSILTLLSLGPAVSAQTVVPARASSEWSTLRQAVSSFEPLTRPATGAWDLVALRVEFQPDTTRFTTGNGTFDGPLFAEGLAAGIDPLPHDADYFEAHLAFLEHYVQAASHGRTTVRTHLLPDVVRVSKPMGGYSPTGPESGTDAELARLAALAREAWSLVPDASGLPQLVGHRTAFVIFHAGVGRDIELTGTTLDRTPEDLPSLFFDTEALDRLAPGTVPMLGPVPVDNTLIVPRTETRQGFDFISDEPYLAEISINGMLAASFLNFLGVPDLFDTDTGESAIGPFGLMDGQGIFAMSGLFPPRPSAWTRTWLGWADPRVLEAGEPVQVTLDESDPTVALVPVSDGEYFLAEARHRDPTGSGVRLTVRRDGSETEVVFESGNAGFNPQSTEAFPGGVVTSVDPYDFALPGGVDADGHALLGGVLIWHVDERVLQAGLSTNRVNADPERRGVDLEEADGAQDIGHPSGGFFGPTFHLGSPFDFWYAGNPASVITSTGSEISLYRNRFGPDTVPSSAANARGDSFVEIGDFSPVGPAMTVSVRRAEGRGASLVEGYPVYLDVDASSGSIKPLGEGVAVFAVDRDGRAEVVLVDDGGIVVPDVDLFAAEPAVMNGAVYALAEGGFVRIGTDGSVSGAGAAPGGPVTGATTQVMSSPDGVLRAGVDTPAGPRLLECSDGVCTTGGDRVLGLALTVAGEVAVFGPTQARLGSLTWSYPAVDAGQGIRPQIGLDSGGTFGAVPDPATGRLHLLRPDGSVLTLDVGSGLGSAPVLVDANGDGRLVVVVTVGDRLWGFERSGAVAAGFPVDLDAMAVSVLATSHGSPVFLLVTADGGLDALDLSTGGRSIAGFPLPVGSAPFPTPLVASNRIWAVSAGGRLAAWNVEEDFHDAQALVDEGNRSFTLLPTTLPDTDGPAKGILVAGETYNWPNPVQGGPTHVRFQLTEPASVTIRITDLVGRLVDEIDVPDPDTGVPVEVVWPAEVPSGVYVARVKATSTSGSQTRLIRMAVIR